jgi:cell division transport system permease protein
MLDKMEFLLGEAAVALRRNALMTFAAITTVAVSLFLLGGLGYIYMRIVQYAEGLPGRFETQVFLRDGATFETVKETIEKIRNIPGVKGAVWIPRDKRWEQERITNPTLTAGLENPYPEAFKVTLSDLSLSDEVAKQIKEFPAVDPNGVVYLEQEQRFVDQALRLLRGIGGTIGGLLFLAGGVLIYMAIRLTVLSRRLEIRVMQLVGASRLTMQVPFLFEGIVQGMIGGIWATIMVWIAHKVLVNYVSSFQSIEAVPHLPVWSFLGILVGVGAFYGFLCSSLAVNTPLKYR